MLCVHERVEVCVCARYCTFVHVLLRMWFMCVHVVAGALHSRFSSLLSTINMTARIGLLFFYSVESDYTVLPFLNLCQGSAQDRHEKFLQNMLLKISDFVIRSKIFPLISVQMIFFKTIVKFFFKAICVIFR